MDPIVARIGLILRKGEAKETKVFSETLALFGP